MSFDAWQALLHLEFKADSLGKTVLSRNLHQGPLMVQKPFYPEKCCHVYMLHPPGGIAGTDSLKFDCIVEPNCHVLVTTPGATKFYKTSDKSSLFIQEFCVKDDSSFEYMPAQNIFFKGTHTEVKTTFNLEGNAKFTFRDVSKCGMADIDDPFANSAFYNTITIKHDGVEKLIETCFIEGDDDLKAISGNLSCPYIGTYMCNAVSDKTLETINEYLQEIKENSVSENNKLSFYAAAGKVSDYLVVRFLSNDNQIIENAIVEIWKMTRVEVIGFEPCPPRIWST